MKTTNQVYYETQYSLDGKKWIRFMDHHQTQEAATLAAQSRRNEEIETRVARVTVEVLERFDKIPGKKAPPVVLHGLGVVS